MGTLKKAVRGIVVVHPMTALGREMGLKEVTGYAKKRFDRRFAVTSGWHGRHPVCCSFAPLSYSLSVITVCLR